MSCPKCGGVSGYFDKNIVSYEQHYTWDGVGVEASEFGHVRGGAQKFCLDCGKRIIFPLTTASQENKP